MAQIRPFAAIRYTRRGLDLSQVIAPPYDVLDERAKTALQAKHPNNIVEIDLPHLPPKVVGPDAAYERAGQTLKRWLSEGILVRDSRPAFYPYMQSFEHGGRMFHRRGFFALVRLSPFGKGQVVPHELTYKGPIEDRLRLMRATGVQLSPIFGLYNDPENLVTAALYRNLGRPEQSAVLEEVRHDLWSICDAEVENRVIDLMGSRPIYIADGHHRYTTALQYQAQVQHAAGWPLPESHPANWCLFVLVGMQDAGLLILPTHRMIGGLRTFDMDVLRARLGATFEVSEVGGADIEHYANHVLRQRPPHTFGLFDGRLRRLYELRLRNADVLAALEPDKSPHWRQLDVAILQRYLLDEVIEPAFAGGELVKGYTADAAQVAPQVDGQRYQIALLLQPTPLSALEQLGRSGEVMPQKSTYFYPKLATGMVINPLQP